MTHTPGPWENTPNSGEIADANGFYVARAINAVTPEGKANARLIAAAPDLLAALEGLVNDIYGDALHAEDVRCAEVTYRISEIYSKFRAARAALAKAKGEA